MKRVRDRASSCLLVVSLAFQALALAACSEDPPAGSGGSGGGGAGGSGGGNVSGPGGTGGGAPGPVGGSRDAGGRPADAARSVDTRRPDAPVRRDAGSGDSAGAAARTVLFDGTSLAAWTSGGGPPRWTIADGAFEVAPGTGDLRTRQRFGDLRLHLEFRVPRTPATSGEQDRGNSGVYLQGRYEIQILDSFDHPLSGANDCASIYGVKDADSNEATPPDTWQTFDIVFRAARFSGATKVANARVSVTWNGTEVQRDVEIRGPTGSGDAESAMPGALRLQEHAHPVRFRNVWLEPLP